MAYVHVLRGGLLESRHRVHVAVVRPDGSLLASAGEPNFTTFLRSSAKPFQAQALIPHLEQFGLDDRHLAIAIASHAGESVHVQTVAELIERAGLEASWLICGVHAPFDARAREDLRARGEKPNVLHNNCSGKHSAMLAVCRAQGLSVEGYAHQDHPLQQRNLETLTQILSTDAVQVAVDGCGVPCYRVSLERAALGFARLVAPQGVHAHGLEVAANAMRAHPYLIAGRERIDTVLMQAVPGAVSKIGAEALIGVGVHSPQYGPLGIALKIEDGAERARDVAVTRVLEALGVIANGDLRPFQFSVLKNVAGDDVGAVQSAFDLIWA